MSVVGYTAIPTTTSRGGGPQVGTALLTMPENGIINVIALYVSGQAGLGYISGVLWGSAGNVLAATSQVPVQRGSNAPGGQAWVAIPMNTFLPAGTQFRIGWWPSANGATIYSVGSISGQAQEAPGGGGSGPSTFTPITNIGAIGAYVGYTPCALPTLVTGPAISVTLNTATLTGSVNPNNADTFYQWQWGLTTAYGNTTTPSDAGSSGGTQSVSASLTSLASNTTYHARIVASNIVGTVGGADISFTTSSQFQAPFAPTPVTPTAGATIDLSNGVLLSAVYNSADGFGQSAYQIQISTNGGAYQYWNGATLQNTPTWVTDNFTSPGGVFTAQIPSSIVSNGNTYTWKAASQESGANNQGIASSPISFTGKSTPTWNAPNNPQTALSDSLNQLHFAHPNTILTDGGEEFGNTAHASFVSLYGISGPQSYASAFMGNGPTIGRMEASLSLPLPEGTSCDVQVSIVNDNAGLPGTTVYASTVVPSDVLLRCAGITGENARMPRYQQADIGAWQTSTSPYPYGNPTQVGFGFANAPTNFITIGGGNGGTNIPNKNVWIGQFGLTDYGRWLPGSPYPIPIWFNGATYANGYIYSIGGITTNTGATTSSTYSAAFNDSVSNMGQWNPQPAYGTTISQAAVCSDGNTVYVVGGFAAGATTASNVLSYAVPSNGNISSWSTATLPFSVANAAAVCINGYIVVIGGSTSTATNSVLTTVWYSPISSTVNSGLPSAWLQGPSLSGVGLTGLSSPNATTYGNSILVTGGNDTTGPSSNALTIALTSTGLWGRWTTLQALPTPSSGGGAASFVGPTGSVWISVLTGAGGNAVSILASGASVPYISIPLPMLSSVNTKYWAIFTPLEENSVNAPQLSLNNAGIGLGLAINTGSGWQPLSSTGGINLRTYSSSPSNPAQSRVIHSTEDGGKRWTWRIYNETNGVPFYFAECVARTNIPSVGSMYGLNYDAVGNLTQIS